MGIADLSVAFGIGLATAIFGSMIWERIKEKRLNPVSRQLVGTWHSAWQTNAVAPGHPNWCSETVNVSQTWWGALRFVNEGNTHGYAWTASARVYWNEYIVGYWRSTKTANSHGTLILHVSTQTDYCLGFFIGPSRSSGGNRNYGAWTMTLQAADLATAMVRLRELGPTLDEVFLAPQAIARP